MLVKLKMDIIHKILSDEEYIIKSETPLAWRAKVCAGLFACRLTCWIWVRLKSCSRRRMPAVISTMETGGVVYPAIASETTLESVSKIASLMPTSHANKTALSMAFASASKGPSGRGRCLLRAAITDPSWSQITTPILIALRFENTAASVFTLYRGVRVGPIGCQHGLWSEAVEDELAEI